LIASTHVASRVDLPPRRLARLFRDESGQDLVEYALVALVMGLGTVAGVHGLASSISSDLTFILNGFTSAVSGH